MEIVDFVFLYLALGLVTFFGIMGYFSDKSTELDNDAKMAFAAAIIWPIFIVLLAIKLLFNILNCFIDGIILLWKEFKS